MNSVRTFFALVVVASIITVSNAHGQSGGVSESAIDFGSVELGDTGSDMVTITNISTVPIIVSASIASGSESANGFSTDSTGFFVLAPATDMEPADTVDVNVFFTPICVGDACDELVIDVIVNGTEESLSVSLIGTGGIADEPEFLIGDILEFFDIAVANGTLVGTGNHPNRRIGAMRNRLRAISFLINRGYLFQASYINRTAIQRADGDPSPTDFVQGVDREFFYDQLLCLQSSLE